MEIYFYGKGKVAKENVLVNPSHSLFKFSIHVFLRVSNEDGRSGSRGCENRGENDLAAEEGHVRVATFATYDGLCTLAARDASPADRRPC